MSIASIEEGRFERGRNVRAASNDGLPSRLGVLFMAILELLALVMLSMGTLGASGCVLFSLDAQDFTWALEGEGWEEQSDGSWQAPADGAVSIAFSSPVRRDALSSIVKVYSHDSEVKTEKIWRDGVLVISASAAWEPGRRYLMVMQGLVQAQDGREDPVDWSLVFHCGRLEPFSLESMSPGDGALFDSSGGAAPELVLSFSHPVNRDSFAACFTLSGFGSWQSDWDESGQTVRVRPEEGVVVQPWVRIPWQLSPRLVDCEGACLLDAVSGSFICAGRPEAPVVAGWFAAIEANGIWMEAVQGLDELREGEVPGVRFSSPMNPATLEAALYLRPARTCRMVPLDAYRAIIVPQQALEPASEWSLCVSQAARDTSGNPLAASAAATFTRASRVFDLESVSLNGEALEREDSGAWRGVLEGYGDSITVDLGFSAPFVETELSSLVRSLRIDPLFPNSLPYPRVTAAEPVGDRRFRVFVAGMGRAGGASWYRLTLSLGGAGLVPDGYSLEGKSVIEVELRP